jgi:hypothetical protein
VANTDGAATLVNKEDKNKKEALQFYEAALGMKAANNLDPAFAAKSDAEKVKSVKTMILDDFDLNSNEESKYQYSKQQKSLNNVPTKP